LGYGRDGLLGTGDDALGVTTDFNPKEQPKVEEPVVIPQVNTTTHVLYEYQVYENNLMANTIKTIEKEAFINCTSLTNLTLSSQLEVIGDKAFFRSGLEDIIVPSSVTEIGEYVFAENNNLVSAIVKCMVIGEYMFSEDKKLKTVSIAYSTQKISKGAFNKCISLKTVTFHSNFIQDVHYELPNGYYPDGSQPAEGTGSDPEDPLPGDAEYVTYLVRAAQKSAITIQNGLDGIEGTADDYYSYGGFYKLIGLDLVAQTVDDIVVLVYENEYYEVIGYAVSNRSINLYRKVSFDAATNSFTYGNYFIGNENGEFSLEHQNDSIEIVEDASGNYTYHIGNIVYSYGADGKLGTLDDIKTVTIDGTAYVVEEINGLYYSILETNVYYEVDVDALE
ncbi:MAG: leucine-rich repeat domain-containing protein, partial [Anaeroplasmataceae bacterium]|nr:leucine-rich repeat domain-containing protein [Anaeroplasmataceae bacterium]